MNLSEHLHEKPSGLSSSNPTTPLPSSNGTKKENCDKITLNKFSKIATLLPKSNTLKGTIKIKRKRLFKRNHESKSSID